MRASRALSLADSIRHTASIARLERDRRAPHLASANALAIVTDNIADFEQSRDDGTESSGRPYQGLIHALNPHSTATGGGRVIGQMVKALAAFLSSPATAQQPFNQTHYLREAPKDM